MACKSSDNFSKLEEKLYLEYPNYKNSKTFFTVNGKIINKLATLEENGIKNGNAIVLNIIDE